MKCHHRFDTIVLLLLLCAFFSRPAVAESNISFSGYVGAKGEFYADPEKDHFDPALALQGYFGGQLNITPSFLLRAEFSVQTDDITKDGPLATTGFPRTFSSMSCPPLI